VKDVALNDLPTAFASALDRSGFRFAYQLSKPTRYVAWQVRSDGQGEELELDTTLGRCLTRDERTKELPAATTQTVDPEKMTLQTTYALDPRTAELRVRFAASDAAGVEVVAVERRAHVPMPWDGAQLVRQALKRQGFPAEYAGWSRDQKVRYWAIQLHRWRRAQGESGKDEDEIYNAGLVRDMQMTDPSVVALLPDVLTQVAQMEQSSPTEAIATFSAKTGVRVAAPAGKPAAR
jgi:hypothetical protein